MPTQSCYSNIIYVHDLIPHINGEQLFNATDLSPITLSVIYATNPRGKNSTNSQINQTTSDENRNSKVCTVKIFLDSGASASIVHKDVLYQRHRNLKDIIVNYGRDL